MPAMGRLVYWMLALAALPAAADEPRVISPRADSVSVTIYRDLFALITETRTLDLPAGPVTLVFEGVVDTLLPQSAGVSDTDRTLAEANYDFDRLTPANLLGKSIGRTVTLTRLNPATGRARQVAATLVAAGPHGIVFHTADGNEALHCSGLPEALSFQEIPGELKREPQLSIRLGAGEPGKRQVRVSYLAHGFGWQANYVARLGDRMDLLGWITLQNSTGSSFRDASVQVVAGKVNLLSAEDGRGTGPMGASADYGPDDFVEEDRDRAMEEMREEFAEEPDDVEYFGGCYPMGTPRRVRKTEMGVDSITAEDVGAFRNVGEELEEVIVTGLRGSMAVREKLADYQMYRLPERTDLQARQTKQVAFLHQPAVRYERFYSVRLAESLDFEFDPENPLLPSVKVGWTNREPEGLGEPLPAGIVRFFEAGAAGEIYVGEDRMPDTPVGTPAELFLGTANDLAFSIDNLAELDEQEAPRGAFTSLLTRRIYFPLQVRVTSAKPRPVIFEVRQGPIYEVEDFRVKGASRPTQRKAGDYSWRLAGTANREATLSYKLGGKLPDGAP
jgi:hypothetical protein